MRLILADEQRGHWAHHMTAEWTGAGGLVFEDDELRVDLGIRLAWSGRDDYGTITQSGDHATLYRLPDRLVIRIEQQEWVHDSYTLLGAQHHTSTDGGRTWQPDPGLDPSRLQGAPAISRVGV